MKFATLAIHAGVEPDPTTGAIMTPIFQTSTYVQQGVGEHKGYEYSRTHNPTRTALQKAIAALEGGKHGLAFASGMAAEDAIIRLLKPGEHALVGNDVYGGTYRLFTKVYEPLGLKFSFHDLSNAEGLISLLTPETKLVWLETPTNPLLGIADIKAICAIAKSKGILTVVDNTFASPYLQQPLLLGADIVVHSATKYIGGHSDTVLGLVVVNDDELATKLAFLQNACGGVPGPQDCFLALRGIKTLHLRMEAHCSNAAVIAQFLVQHPRVSKVYWPGLPSHPNHLIATAQMRNFGGMVSFSLHQNTLEAANNILKKVKLFSLAESLGGVESLIGHPATMTHASIPKEQREARGITDSFIRLSVGVEDVNDLVADLEAAIS